MTNINTYVVSCIRWKAVLKKKAFGGINSLHSVLQGVYENILGPWKKLYWARLRLAQYNFFHGPNIFSYTPCKTLYN